MSTGLIFPGRPITGAVRIAFGWSQGANTGLATVAPFTPYPATFIANTWPRNQYGTNQQYSTGFFHANDDTPGNFGGASVYRYYSGWHWINDGSGFNPDGSQNPTTPPNGPKWEISVGGTDITGDKNGSAPRMRGDDNATVIETGRWHIAVSRAWIDGSGNAQHEFYFDWPNTAKVLKYTILAGNILPLAPAPMICIGDNPWEVGPGDEIWDGILRGFQIYNVDLGVQGIADSLKNPFAVATPWYLNLNPTPTDITDKSGGNHHPAWFNANRPTLYTAPDAVMPGRVLGYNVRV